MLSVILIPQRIEFEQVMFNKKITLHEAIWWKTTDYALFKSAAILEIKKPAHTNKLPPLKAMEDLYQPNQEAVTNSKIPYYQKA